MDKRKLLAALREETLPGLEGARAALKAAQLSGAAKELTPVRELCHRAAGTGAVAGVPQLSRLGAIGEAVTQLALEGEARVSQRLLSALTAVLDGLEAELNDQQAEAQTPAEVTTPMPTAPVAEGKGKLAIVSDELVSGKLLARVLADAGFEVTRLKLDEAAQAPSAEVVVLDLPSAEARLAQVDAALTAALAARLPVLLAGKADSGAFKPLIPRASQFVPKPVDPELLVTAARTLVARRRLAAAARSKAPTARLPGPAKALPFKVLIVDDSRVIRGVVREALAEVGLQSVEAEDGATAVRIYDAEKPDAVISDVQMPGLDGAQLTRLLRERSPTRRIPIVVLSALDDEGSRAAGLAAGADAYLVKSVIEGPALLAALKKAGLPIS